MSGVSSGAYGWGGGGGGRHLLTPTAFLRQFRFEKEEEI
jgi:hypothetical protein